MSDYYAILNLPHGSGEAEIRQAINRELRLWSSRTNAPQMERRQEAERRLKLIEEAERVLLGPEFHHRPEGSSSNNTPVNRPPPSSRPEAARPQTVAPKRARLGCAGWIAVGGALVLLVGIVSGIFDGHDDKKRAPADTHAQTPDGSDNDSVAQLKNMSEAEAYSYGYGQIKSEYDLMMNEAKDQLYPESVLNQSRTSHGGTELTRANVDGTMRASCVEMEQQIQAEVRNKAASDGVREDVLAAYLHGRQAGVYDLNRPVENTLPTNTTSQAAVPAPGSPLGESAPENDTKTAEKSPLGDLIVLRRKGKEDENGNTNEIWIACVDGSRSPEHLCNHDFRSGQVSFSPGEHWIIVTDGGGPGSSMGTTLRAFRRETQNIYDEIKDAGIEEWVAKAALRSRNAPPGVELDHIYAEVEGWSADGRSLKVNVWGHGGGYSLDLTEVSLQGFYHGTATVFRVPGETPAATASPDSQTPGGSNGDYIGYVNGRHGYSVTVPAILAANLREQPSGDEASATSSDGRTKFLLRVKSGVGTLKSLYKQWTAEHTAKDPGKVVDYKTLRNNWFVVSGFDGPRAYYVKVVMRGSDALFLCLEYDRVGGNLTPEMLTTMSRSFTGGVDPSYANPTPVEQPSRGLPPGATNSSVPQQALPENGGAATYENRDSTNVPGAVTASQPSAVLSRVYTVPELKKLIGSHPTGAGLRGDFVLVKKEGNQVLLQSRVEMRDWFPNVPANDPMFRGHTFVNVTCYKDISGLIRDQIVTIPAEQPLRIISVSRSGASGIDVQASF